MKLGIMKRDLVIRLIIRENYHTNNESYYLMKYYVVRQRISDILGVETLVHINASCSMNSHEPGVHKSFRLPGFS